MAGSRASPTTYAIRVDGQLDDHWSAWLGDLDMTRDDDDTTTITVSVADQAQLHGHKARALIRDRTAAAGEMYLQKSLLKRPFWLRQARTVQRLCPIAA